MKTPPNLTWHILSAKDAQEKLDSPAGGLTQSEAARRLTEYGPNELIPPRPVSAWTVLLDQFKNVLILILLFATGLSAFLGHGLEALAITIIVLFAVGLGFIQEYRAERAIQALRKMAAPTATVVRDLQDREVAARDLVPGDIVLVKAGSRIPADMRLVESINLQIEEAALTGESVPAIKQSGALDNPEVPLGDRRNMAYAGTAATYGRGRGLVVATAMETEFGKIAQLLQTVKTPKTPLQINLDKVGSMLAKAAFVVVALIVALGLVRGQPLVEMLIFGIALAVAVVPEALPAVVTISLAIGVQRLVKRNALIRHLPAVETLGSTSVICSDKTGTLTKDEMTVRKIYTAGELHEVSGVGYDPSGRFTRGGELAETSGPLKRLLTAAALASDARLVRTDSGAWDARGDPTEAALVAAAAKADLLKEELEAKFPRVDEIPFTSETKRMTTLHCVGNSKVACAKGAPEVVVDSCTRQALPDGDTVLDEASRAKILETARQMAAEALRVLAVAVRENATRESAEREMTFLGLVGMIDPPRPEAKFAVQRCQKAGIKPVMITGDHPVTAEAVARELGLLKTGGVVTGAELEAMSETDFDRQVEDIDVYARVSPVHKLRVVTAMQRKGQVVAMTGDGVNDAPALKKADIGIAMGITGTDVTKEAAGMTLTDDNFASIVAAVEEGRGIFGNIKKYLMYLLSSNMGEIALMAAATLLGMPLPLAAVQILYVNLATDGLPALALAVDPPESDLMQRRPRNPRTGIFTRPVITLITVGGLWSGITNLGVFTWAINSGRSAAEAMTMTFVSLVLIEFFKAYNFRSDWHSVLRRPFANKWLNLAILWELGLLVLVVYTPFLQKLFGTYGLSLVDWMIVLIPCLTISPVLEAAKWMGRRGWLGDYEPFDRRINLVAFCLPDRPRPSRTV